MGRRRGRRAVNGDGGGTRGDGHTAQHADDVWELCTRNPCDFANQCHPLHFRKSQQERKREISPGTLGHPSPWLTFLSCGIESGKNGLF